MEVVLRDDLACLFPVWVLGVEMLNGIAELKLEALLCRIQQQVVEISEHDASVVIAMWLLNRKE